MRGHPVDFPEICSNQTSYSDVVRTKEMGSVGVKKQTSSRKPGFEWKFGMVNGWLSVAVRYVPGRCQIGFLPIVSLVIEVYPPCFGGITGGRNSLCVEHVYF